MWSPARLWLTVRTRLEIRRQLAAGTPLRLHIGCGAFLLPGWLNLDQTPRAGAFYLDAGRPLPFPDGCVHRLFHEHFLEHLELDEARGFLQECARVLEPGALMRLSTPDLALIVATYLDQNPHVRLEQALERHGRLVRADQPLTAARLFNDKMRHWGHRFIYDRETLWSELERAGFEEIRCCRFGESEDPELRDLERHADVPWMRTAEPLIVEARRAGEREER